MLGLSVGDIMEEAGLETIDTSGEHRLDICLVVPPFDRVDFPALGVSILAAACKARGFSVKIVYGSMQLAARMGFERYEAVRKTSLRTLVGERLFQPHAYPDAQWAMHGERQPLSEPLQRLHDKAAGHIPGFVDQITDEIVALNPRILGITTNFQQNLAASSVARRVKAAAPHIPIVLGGANVAGAMGRELARVFTWVDYVFDGEADLTFPDFCERLLAKGDAPQDRVVACEPIADMGVVHAPEFSDYFTALRRHQDAGNLPAELPAFLTMETSRGCWWGQKHHCTFCGLNGEGMGFRHKDPRRTSEEIRTLTKAWDAKRFHFSDNIMPMDYLGDLLPELAAWEGHPRLFFEVKANLREDQLKLMASAGIDVIQPGIESLSSHVLKLMRKGVSGHQNLSLLRICLTLKIGVAWNCLYGFPGETVEDYEAFLELMPKIEHLQPPSGFTQISLDRFSPYHSTPEQFGIGALTPFKSYNGLYPAHARLADIAYHFNGDYVTPLLANPDLIAKVTLAIGVWQNGWRDQQRLPVVRVIDRGSGEVAIADTRRIAASPLTVISREMLETLVFLERPQPATNLAGADAGHIQFLRERNFVIEHEAMVQSVVTRPLTIMKMIAAEAPGTPAEAPAMG